MVVNNARRDRTTTSASQDEGEVIATVHGITTEADGTRDDDDASGEAVVVASFSSFFALPPPPALSQRKIHATPTTIATTDISDLAADQTDSLNATARIDAAARDEARARGPPSPASPVATRANPSAASMTTREAHEHEEEAKNRFATSMHK
jgi:hypothetical protein